MHSKERRRELEREELKLNENLMAWIVKMAEGNNGAMTVLLTVMKEKGVQKMGELILFLDDMNMRGAQIWMGYKDCCGCDIDKFIECVDKKDQEMIDKINEESLKEGIRWKAVPHSASVLGREFLD